MKMNMNAYFGELRECLAEIKNMCQNINEYNPTEYEYIMNDDATISDKIEKIADKYHSKLNNLYYVTNFMSTNDDSDFNMVDDVKDVIRVSIWTLEKALIDGAYDTFLDDGEKRWKFVSKEIEMCNDELRKMITV